MLTSNKSTIDSRQIIGCSPEADALRHEIELATRTDTKVLITGETGVGKEVVARLIHSGSQRRKAPFIAINCAGIPETLLESEFFGHTRGSFTDAYRDQPGLLRQCDHGTAFLDEVGEMTPRLQALLLRFLETGELQTVGGGRTSVVNVRIIAATNRDLTQRADAGEFRSDLYYRLNVVRIDIPPLRERREDIPLLLNHFLAECATEHGRSTPEVPSDVMAALVDYDWPGNVRQLRNVAERILVRTASSPIHLRDLPAEIVGRPTTPSAIQDARVDALWRQLVVDRESFWTCVYPLFKTRELTREQLCALLARGLKESRGYYRGLLSIFNMPGNDYKRFMNFLASYDCKLPSQLFRMGRRDSGLSTPFRERPGVPASAPRDS